MPVQLDVRPRLSQGAAGTHYTAWSANNARVWTRALENTSGLPSLYFGRPAFEGSIPGQSVSIDVGGNFEGVLMNNFLIEHNLADGYSLEEGAAVGVCDIGDVWVKLADGDNAGYGAAVFVTGDETGRAIFTSQGGTQVPGRFLGERTEDGLAPVEIRRG